MITRLPLDPEKLIAALLFISSRISDPSKWRLGKLIFLGDFAHLARYGRPIVGGHYCAMANGPVPSEALDLLNALLDNKDPEPMFWGMSVERAFNIARDVPYPLFKPAVEANLEVLSESDIEMLDKIVAQYGKMSFNQLSKIVHDLPAFIKATEREPDSKNPDMDYEDFFDDNPFVVSGTKEELVENYSLSRAFPQLAV